ncbi:hypothetical protein N9R46_04295 [Gammaproteobacteria bacterium]|jgi:hypothetical protein|nr:hypothetical protein [Gammaproteobacteria bacterium]MDA9356463.1 hypothetical protein [Gammaproteobacteria bacterium]
MKNLNLQNIDPILKKLDEAIDKKSAKRMLAFEYFNNNMSELSIYLNSCDYYLDSTLNLIEPKVQLEFRF